jgi:hypothetical protein
MSKFLTPQLARLAAGLVVVSAFGAAPMLAQALAPTRAAILLRRVRRPCSARSVRKGQRQSTLTGPSSSPQPKPPS